MSQQRDRIRRVASQRTLLDRYDEYGNDSANRERSNREHRSRHREQLRSLNQNDYSFFAQRYGAMRDDVVSRSSQDRYSRDATAPTTITARRNTRLTRQSDLQDSDEDLSDGYLEYSTQGIEQ